MLTKCQGYVGCDLPQYSQVVNGNATRGVHYKGVTIQVRILS